MAYDDKTWENAPSTNTRLNAAGLNDWEARIASAFADEAAARTAGEASLDARLDTAEGSLTALNTRLTTAEGGITTLDGRLDTAEGGLAAITPRVVAAGNLTGTHTLDMESDFQVTLIGTLTANLALTLTNMVAGATALLLLTQDATGGRTLSVTFGGDTTPVEIPNGAGEIAGVRAYYDGTDLYLTGTQGPQGEPGPDNKIVGKTVPALTATEDGYSWEYDHDTGAMVWKRKLDAAHRGVVLRKTADQVTTLNAHEWVTWDSEVEDPDGMHDNVTDNHLVTIPAGGTGWWRVSASISHSNNNGFMYYRLIKNATGGPTAGTGVVLGGLSVDGYLQSFATVYWEGPLAAGDTLALGHFSNEARTITYAATSYQAASEFRVMRAGT